MTDSKVWLVKSHWPERRGREPVEAHASVLLVRNPLDVLDSYWNMVLTSSHTHSVVEGEYSRLSTEWESMVRREVRLWAAFHRYWLSAATHIPVLVLRYEDLLHEQVAILIPIEHQPWNIQHGA